LVLAACQHGTCPDPSMQSVASWRRAADSTLRHNINLCTNVLTCRTVSRAAGHLVLHVLAARPFLICVAVLVVVAMVSRMRASTCTASKQHQDAHQVLLVIRLRTVDVNVLKTSKKTHALKNSFAYLGHSST
jgi:hypothetical protein